LQLANVLDDFIRIFLRSINLLLIVGVLQIQVLNLFCHLNGLIGVRKSIINGFQHILQLVFLFLACDNPVTFYGFFVISGAIRIFRCRYQVSVEITEMTTFVTVVVVQC